MNTEVLNKLKVINPNQELPEGITFGIDKNALTLHLPATSVVKNMQEDSAAFDA